MTVTITATTVPAGTPEPVQLVIDDIGNGDEFTIVGSLANGDTWTVPGGVGVGTGSQIALVDNRAALNVAITYRVHTGGAIYEADPITVDYPERYVLQSLDGQTLVDLVWRANGLPRDYTVRTAAYDVPGRSRPPLRVVRGGDGGGALSLRTSKSASAALVKLLHAGHPVVVRTDGAVRDWPAVELIQITAASSETWDAVDSVTGRPSSDRVWRLSYLLVDDPQPSVVVSAFTWDDFDAAGLTWDDFDAAGLTWDEFDTYPWTQL